MSKPLSPHAKKIVEELLQHADGSYALSSKNFFREPIALYGVRTPIVRNLARRYWPVIKALPKQTFFPLCEELLALQRQEPLLIAFQWTRSRKDLAPSDVPRFSKWLRTYVTNWASCDDFSTGFMGRLLIEYPELLAVCSQWARHKSPWVRRASVASLIPTLRTGRGLVECFSIAMQLMSSKEDLVQKGYGWMLKEASNTFPDEVLAFVLKHKDSMSRTAFRYAIEKLPKELRHRAMHA